MRGLQHRRQRADQCRAKAACGRIGQIGRQVAQCLVGPIERAGLQQADWIIQPQALGNMCETAIHGQRGRGEHPGRHRALPMLAQRSGNIHRRALATEAPRGQFIPQDLGRWRRLVRIGVEIQHRRVVTQPARQARCRFRRARMAGIQAGRRITHPGQRIAQLHQRAHRGIEAIAHLWHGQGTPLGTARGQAVHGHAQIAQGLFQRGRGFLQGRLRTGHAATLGQAVARQLLPRAHAEAFAEEVGRQFRQLVRLVDHERLGARQDLAEAFLLERQIGQQQMVIDHHHVGGLRPLPCLHDEAVIPERAFGAQTVVDGGGHHRVQR